MSKNGYMLKSSLKKNGYDWWWHSLVAINKNTNELKPFFIEYYIINPYTKSNKPIFGQLEENKRNNIKPSYAMIKAGTWGEDAVQIHNFYGINDFNADYNKMDVRIGENIANDRRLKGKVTLTKEESESHSEYMCGYGEMEWDLNVNKILKYDVGYGASKFMRCLNAFQMYWHVEGMKTEYSGTIIFNGEEYEVIPERSYGYQDKNWGKDYTNPWLWLNCNNFISANTGGKLNMTSLDVGGGRPVLFGVPFMKKLLIAFYYEGKLYEFNFSKFWRRERQTFDIREDPKNIYWDIVAWNRRNRIEINFWCPKNKMLLVNYENPAGEKNHNKLWNGGFASGNVKLYTKRKREWHLLEEFTGSYGGCEYGEY